MYFISYVENHNTWGQVLTALHPIEWLARQNASTTTPSTVILFYSEVNAATVGYIQRRLAGDGITLDFLEE